MEKGSVSRFKKVEEELPNSVRAKLSHELQGSSYNPFLPKAIFTSIFLGG